MITLPLLITRSIAFFQPTRFQPSVLTQWKLATKPGRLLRVAMSSSGAGGDDDDEKPYVVRPKDIKIPMERYSFNICVLLS
jgi:hypothetical protein